MLPPARSDLAFRALLELAAAEGRIIPAEQMVSRRAIPGRVLPVLMTGLRRAGLVLEQRGPHGGFCLSRPAADISLADLAEAISRLDGGGSPEPPALAG
jgi:Rrf2 family protein